MSSKGCSTAVRSGIDIVKGKMRVVVSKVKTFMRKTPTMQTCDCEVNASVTGQYVTFAVPDRNIVISMRIMDVVEIITAANNRYRQVKVQENFKKAMAETNGGKENG